MPTAFLRRCGYVRRRLSIGRAKTTTEKRQSHVSETPYKEGPGGPWEAHGKRRARRLAARAGLEFVKIAERITNKNGRGTSWPASRLRDRLKSTTHPPQKMNFCRCPLSPHTIFSTNLPVQTFFVCPAYGADVPRPTVRCRWLPATLECGNALGTGQRFSRGRVLCGRCASHDA